MAPAPVSQQSPVRTLFAVWLCPGVTSLTGQTAVGVPGVHTFLPKTSRGRERAAPQHSSQEPEVHPHWVTHVARPALNSSQGGAHCGLTGLGRSPDQSVTGGGGGEVKLSCPNQSPFGAVPEAHGLPEGGGGTWKK